MRLGTGLGLLGLLIVVALIFYLFTQNAATVSRTNKEIRPQAEQIAGRGPDGAPASESVKLDPKLKNGKTDSLLVTDVTAGGALDQFFGLQKGDEIIQVGEMKVADLNDDQLAAAMVYEAGQRGQTLIVRRAGQTTPLTPKGPLQFKRGNIPMH